jgi:hypothetical protein
MKLLICCALQIWFPPFLLHSSHLHSVQYMFELCSTLCLGPASTRQPAFWAITAIHCCSACGPLFPPLRCRLSSWIDFSGLGSVHFQPVFCSQPLFLRLQVPPDGTSISYMTAMKCQPPPSAPPVCPVSVTICRHPLFLMAGAICPLDQLASHPSVHIEMQKP